MKIFPPHSLNISRFTVNNNELSLFKNTKAMLSHPMFLHAVPASKKALSAGIISLWRSKDTGILYFSRFEVIDF